MLKLVLLWDQEGGTFSFVMSADFPGLGGVEVILEILLHLSEVKLQSEALHLLGTAASNNPEFQLQALQEARLVPAICTVSLSSVRAVHALCLRRQTFSRETQGCSTTPGMIL